MTLLVADQGFDAASQKLIRRTADALGLIPAATIVVSPGYARAGGVWSTHVARSFEHALARQTRGATIAAGVVAPIDGAVALAREHLERR